MISISRSLLLAAGLLALPLVGAVAQAVDTGKSTGPSSPGDKSLDSKNDSAAMKSTAPGYENKSSSANEEDRPAGARSHMAPKPLSPPPVGCSRPC
jgi:hypothetical protein